jgi:hypothetical protein
MSKQLRLLTFIFYKKNMSITEKILNGFGLETAEGTKFRINVTRFIEATTDGKAPKYMVLHHGELEEVTPDPKYMAAWSKPMDIDGLLRSL